MHHLGAVVDHLRRAALAYAVLLVALVLTLLASYYVRQNVEASTRVRFDDTVQASREAIGRRLDRYVNVMFGARGLFSASSTVNEEEWRGFVNGLELEQRNVGIQMLGYAPRSEGVDSYPIAYAEPHNRANAGLVGYDPYAMTEDRATMDRARDTGEVELTGKTFVLVEASPASPADLALEEGVVAYLPVYREGAPHETVAERRRALDGFIVAYLPMDRLLRGIVDESFDPSVDIEVYDGKGLTPRNLLYDDDGVWRAGQAGASAGSFGGALSEVTGLTIGSSGSRSSLSNSVPLGVAGREWSLYFEALPGFERGEKGRLPLFVLLSGLGVSLLLFGVTYMLVRARLRSEEAGAGMEEANRELEVTNRELEAFSYSVSHDLRAPLRSIDGFSQILLEDYADELDEEGKDYLGRVRAASQRMGRLIDDLLGLSRVTRGALRREQVDLSFLAREVAAILEESRPDRAVDFEIEGGIEVYGDPRLIRVALTNLLGNAFKFTEKEERARIDFGQDKRLSQLGRVPVYYVRDNGAGFDMEYADKLFGAFQRLHGTDEFEGTGIGLATVQRIVHRHGGRAWAEGRVGEGATFFFTLRPGLQIDPSRDGVREVPREEAEAR